MERPAVDTHANWAFEQLSFDRRAMGRDATLFALANGVLGVRGAIDELPYGHASFLPDAYMRRPIRYHESFPGFADHSDTRLSGPGVTAIRIFIDGERVDFEAAKIVAFWRSLDPATGVLTRTTQWCLPDGREVSIRALRMVPFDGGAVCVTQLTIVPENFAATISVECVVAAASSALSEPDHDDPRINARTAMVATSSTATPMGQMSVFRPSEGGKPAVAVLQRLTRAADCGGDDERVEANLAAGEALSFTRFAALSVVAGGEDTTAFPAAGALSDAVTKGLAALASRQKSILDDYWLAAAISIDGEARLERGIAFNLFHLFQSASRSPTHSIAAKGLTGEGYEGQYFWDTDAFVAPLFALLAPELARNLIAHRCSRLDDARAHARALGHVRGALFPWRTIAGRECSAHYPTGSAQIHVNAAIAYALECYELASGDSDLVDQVAAETLFETARLWFDVGHFSARRDGAFVIHCVTGPDEYSALVDNDFYTNAMARRHLRYAARTARRLSQERPDVLAALAARIGFIASEADDWSRAADAMWLPVDAQACVHPQDDAFLGKPLWDLSGHGRADDPLLMRYHPMLLFRHQLCKQGDVLQALWTGDITVSQSLMRRDLDYYEPLTTHDSTLSATAFAIIAARVGADTRALGYTRETTFVDLEDLHGNSAQGSHMAAMAGSWLALVQGWGGVAFDDGSLRLTPRCPTAWRGYSFRLRWRGNLLEVAVTAASTHYRLIEGDAIELFDHGRAVHVDTAGANIAAPTLLAVIFDLDGVLTDTAEAHYAAWKHLCDEEGMAFDHAFNEQLKGVDRAASLTLILKAAGREVDATSFGAMMARKNSYYQQIIAHKSPTDLFHGARELLIACNKAGLLVGLASASRNARDLITRLGISDLIDHITDAATVERGKPDPEIFLKTAHALGVPPSACIGIEDALAGIVAIHAAGMPAIGIGASDTLSDADRVFPTIAALTLPDLFALMGAAPVQNQEDHLTKGVKQC